MSSVENKKKYVLLDWDGTCINPKYEIKIYNQTLGYMEKTFPHYYTDLPRMPENEVFRGHTAKKLRNLLKLEHVELAQLEAMAIRRTLDDSNLDIEWMPGAKAAIEKLSQNPNIVLMVASNQYHDSLNEQIKALGADKYITIAEGHQPKKNDYKPESGDILRRALDKAGASNDDVVILAGDTKYDFLTRNSMRDYPYFYPVIVGGGEHENIYSEMTTAEKTKLLEYGTRSPYCADTYGFTPTLEGLPVVLGDIDVRVDKKKSSAFNIDYFSSDFVALEGAANKLCLKPREYELPEKIINARNFSDTQSEEEYIGYYIAEKGKFPNGETVNRRQQIEHAFPIIENIINNKDSNFIESLLEKIKASNPSKNEKVTLFYPWRHEGEGTAIRNTNIVPAIFASILSKKINQAIEQDKYLSGLDLNIRSKPLYHKTKNQRKELSPFQKLVARSYFEVPPADGKAIILDDDTLSGMSIAEMCNSVAHTNAEIIAVAVTSAYDGAERLQIHPAVKQGLIEAIQNNTGENEKPVKDFNAILKKVGFSKGIESMTNMEAMTLIARLYDKEAALPIIKHLWDEFHNVSLEKVNENMMQLGRPVWNGMLGSKASDDKSSEHFLLRSCEMEKLDFYAGIRDMIQFVQQRGEELQKLSPKVLR